MAGFLYLLVDQALNLWLWLLWEGKITLFEVVLFHQAIPEESSQLNGVIDSSILATRGPSVLREIWGWVWEGVTVSSL